VYQGPKSIEDFQHNTGTMFCRNGVYERAEKLKNGLTSVTHEEGAGRPPTSTTDDSSERVREMVLLDRRLTIHEVANRLQVSHGSAYEIIHNILGFSKVCARWFHKQLTMLHKQTRLEFCQQNLEHYDKEGEAFLDRIINGAETWVCHHEQECKRQSMEWKLPQSPVRKKFKSQPSTGKLILTALGIQNTQYWNIIRRWAQQ
jgi:histone-lysine N-methyltransferase SETMAR